MCQRALRTGSWYLARRRDYKTTIIRRGGRVFFRAKRGPACIAHAHCASLGALGFSCSPPLKVCRRLRVAFVVCWTIHLNFLNA
jgi:hypothetical protein